MSGLSVYFSFARSGGTLLNQCLGCHADNVVLSEVNPRGCVTPVEFQARHWFGLLSEAEARAFEALDYGPQVAWLVRRAAERGKRLIVRDWCAVNFLAGVSGQYLPPEMELVQASCLAAQGLTFRAIALTRHAASVFASIRRTHQRQAGLTVDDFAVRYLAYARHACHYPRFKLESFLAAPGLVFPAICEALGAGCAPDFQKRFHAYDRCTGNNTVKSRPASSIATTIIPGDRGGDSEFWQEAARHPLCQEANALLGYRDCPATPP